MSDRLEEVLEIGGAPAPAASVTRLPRTSRIAKTSLVLGILAGVAGFASLMCGPPRHDLYFFDASGALTAAVLFTVLFSVLGVLTAAAACIRIAASGKKVTGYRLCLVAVVLAVVANVVWLAYFSVSL